MLTVAGGILLALVAVTGSGCSPQRPAQPQQVQQLPPVGRWQVVNGTPDLARNIMLLDTQTGETWQICGAKLELAAWCKMERHD